MRVTVLSLHYSPEPSGNAPYVADLAAGLSEAGHKVTVITSHPFYPQWKRYEGYGPSRSQEKHAGVTVVRRKHYIPRRLNAVTRLLSELSAGWGAVREGTHDADAVVLVSPALFHATLVSLKLRLRKRIPWIVWVQDLYSLGATETGVGGRAARALAWTESLLLRSADRVVSIHDRFTRVITSDLGADSARITTIRNWTHLSTLEPARVPRAALGWGDGEFVVLHAGNQGVKQGLINVVEAARLADRLKLPLRFVLLGDGNQRKKLEELAYGSERIQFIDPLPDEEFRGAMAAADALLVNELPTLREMSVPSKLTSYFSTGLPVLAATDSASVTAEEIRRSAGGLVVEGGDPQALIDGAMRLRADPELRRTLGVAAMQYRENELGREQAIARFRDVIESSVLKVQGR